LKYGVKDREQIHSLQFFLIIKTQRYNNTNLVSAESGKAFQTIRDSNRLWGANHNRWTRWSWDGKGGRVKLL